MRLQLWLLSHGRYLPQTIVSRGGADCIIRAFLVLRNITKQFVDGMARQGKLPETISNTGHGMYNEAAA